MPDSARMARLGGAVCAVAALLAASVAAVALDALAPGAGPLVQPLSSFAHTEYAWLWRLTVGAGAAGLLFLAGSLRRRATSPMFTLGLAAAGVGLGVAGACPADLWFPWERAPTVGGGAHIAAVGLAVVALSAAIAGRSRSLPGSSGAPWYRAGEVAYWGTVAGAVAYLGAGAAAGRPPHWFGLWERLVLGSAWAWCSLLAVGALRGHPDDPSRAAAPAG